MDGKKTFNDSDVNALMASFIKNEEVEDFISSLVYHFKLKRNNIYVFEMEENESEKLLTFKVPKEPKIDFNKYDYKVIKIQCKQGCIFSINALNEIRKKERFETLGNSYDEDDYKIDFSKYSNMAMLTKFGVLNTYHINRIK